MPPRPNDRRPTDRHIEELKNAFALFQRGDRTAALARLGRVLRADPKNPTAHRIAALVHHAARDLDRALYHAEKAVALAPGVSQPLTILGSVLHARGDSDAALDAMRRAVEINPGDAEGMTTLAITLDALDRFDEARPVHDRALALSPNHAAVGMNAALSFLMSGRARDAADLMHRLAGVHPRDPQVAERLAYCLNYDDRATRAHINAAHRRWGEIIQAAAPLFPPRPPRSSGRARLAILSPDLRRHSVASFLPIFDHIDRDRFELTVYFTSSRPDDTTEEFRARADAWHNTPGLSTTELANLVHRHRPDVVIELSGLFAGHRLPVLARRPAPLQITWLGYPGTTGLSRIDARFVDSLTDPPSLTDDRPSATREAERLVRLDPCFLCYSPPSHAPDPAPAPPSAGGEPFTFASFNDAKKISPTTIDMWAAILARTPASRLLLKAGPLASRSVRRHLSDAFESRGVAPERLLLEQHTPDPSEHLANYRRADLALDTYPYCGTTTTCEALWMGVPVLSRVGETHAARVGLTLLTAVGIPELCTDTAEDYIDRAVGLAQNPGRLASLREGLRARAAAGPLTDAPAFTTRFQRAILDLLAAGPN